MRSSSLSLGPVPTISRGLPERRVSSSESSEERSLSIGRSPNSRAGLQQSASQVHLPR
jgi:hypothetical protein